MSKVVFPLLISALLAACRHTAAPESGAETAAAPAPPAKDMSNYELVELPGTGLRRATLKDASGKMLEQGYIDENGLQTGEWLLFYPNSRLPYKLITYRDGVQNGLYIFFNEIGQISLLATYKDNLLDGYWVKYRFSRPEEEAEYKAGKMHGTHRQYFVREGWLQSTTEYKDGVPHGMQRTYNQAGEVTLEYEFKDGKKVSGGMK